MMIKPIRATAKSVSRLNRRQVLSGLGLPALLPIAYSKYPKRIVSLNPCMDALLVDLADPDQIAALSHYSSVRHQSAIYALARSFPKTHGTAEEVVLLQPDLVLSTPFESRSTRLVIEQLQLPVFRMDVPETLDDNLRQIRDFARIIGQSSRAEALIGRINTSIRAARPNHQRRVKTLLYQPGGFAAGQGTLISDMMEMAGLENLAGQYGVGKWGSVSIEQMLLNPPELLLVSKGPTGAKTRAEQMLEHPALRRVARNIVHATFDESLLYCGGPVLIRTAAALAQARDQALRQL